MKKLIFPLMAVALFFAASCGSDDNGNERGGNEYPSLKKAEVFITPDYHGADGREISTGDLLYVCNNSAGGSGVVSEMRYDASTKRFVGAIEYRRATDVFRCYIKFKDASKVVVDTARRSVSIDYAGQNGTMADAHSRDMAYSKAVTAAQLTSATPDELDFYNATAYLRIKHSNDVSPKLYRLYSSATETKKQRTSVVISSLGVVRKAKIEMMSSINFDEDGRLSCTPRTDGDTYLAFFAQDMLDPVVEAEITLKSGVNLIQNEAVDGEKASEASELGGKVVSFDGGEQYAVDIDDEVEPGSFLCDGQFNVKAIVYDDENIDFGEFRTARAMAVTDYNNGETLAWSTANVLPSSMSKYVTTNVMGDMNGYNLSEYYAGANDFLAVNTAAKWDAALKGCSAWYLPSAGEWVKFCNNLGGIEAVNRLLKQAGAPRLSGLKYWTSSLHNLTEPYVVAENGKKLLTLPQPLNSKNALRAGIVF